MVRVPPDIQVHNAVPFRGQVQNFLLVLVGVPASVLFGVPGAEGIAGPAESVGGKGLGSVIGKSLVQHTSVRPFTVLVEPDGIIVRGPERV